VTFKDLDYEAASVDLKGTGSGFSLQAPQNGLAVPMSVPTSTADAGSVTITYQAQTLFSTDTVKWAPSLLYRPSDPDEASGFGKALPPTIEAGFNTMGSTASQPQKYTGQGGFLNAMAMADSASMCAMVPLSGWATDTTKCTSGAAPLISSELNLNAKINFVRARSID
jgi:hypothetical protein